MTKKEFNIQDLITLQKTVETMISNITLQLIKANPVLKKHKGDVVDTNKLYDKYERLSAQLNLMKMAIAKANRLKTSRGVSNQTLIFELSNLKRQKILLERMFTSKNSLRDGGEPNAWDFQISKSVIDERILDIDEKMTEIKETMTDFNTSHTAKIVIDETLDLV